MEKDKSAASDPTQNRHAATDTLRKIRTGVTDFWEKQPRSLQVSIGIIFVLMIAAVVMLTTVERTNARTLYSNLTPEDTAEMIDFLKSKKIPYELDEQGSRIMVPSENVHELRIELAREGLPKGGGVGFELFDEQKFGMTEFEERVAMRRALEGEMSRTIARIKTIKNAKANLVLPKRSLLGRKESAAQASIVLELHRGRELPAETINAIVHMVSSSVEGLNPDSVTIVDTNGKLLSAKSSIAGAGKEGHQYQKKFETDLQNSIQEMLNQLLGPGKAITRVAADFDFSQNETHSEQYDPRKTAVRSERRELETSGTQTGGGEGIPGPTTNLPGGEAPDATSAGSNSRRELETKNWEIDKVVRKIVGSGSELKRITVSVLVDGINPTDQPFVPRPEEELKKIERAVQGAMGFHKERGDLINVQSISFHQPEPLNEDALKSPFPWKEYLPMGVGALVVILAFLALLLFRKSTRNNRSETSHRLSGQDAYQLPRPVHELEDMMTREKQLPGQIADSGEAFPDATSLNAPAYLDAYAAKTAELMSEVRGVFHDDPETSARILSAWLHDSTAEQTPSRSREEAV